MSLAEDLDDFFADSDEVVVNEPLKFKAKLGIGDRAYGLLRAREKMTTFSEAIGIGATASSVAASGTVASTFFASSGFMASTLSTIGLGAAAATPIGWVIAAGVISGGAYLGVSNVFEKSKDNGLVVVPKYINTPLDVIAVALIELMLPVSLKIAHADGGMKPSEQRAIQNFFCDDWGYNPGFVSRLISEYRHQIDGVSYSRLATSLGTYCAESKDCDKQAIMTGFIEHLREVIEADNVIHEQEKAQLDYLTGLLIDESEKAGGSTAVTDALNAASNGLSQTRRVVWDMASSAGDAAITGLSTGANFLNESSKAGAGKSAELASTGFQSGSKFARNAGELTVKRAKSFWRNFSRRGSDDPENGTS